MRETNGGGGKEQRQYNKNKNETIKSKYTFVWLNLLKYKVMLSHATLTDDKMHE